MQATTPTNTNEQQIREMAYFLWLEAGRPMGEAESHWEKAKKLAEAPAPAKSASKKVSTPPNGRSRTKKRTLPVLTANSPTASVQPN